MRTRANRGANLPPVIKVKFENWEEYDEYVKWADREGGTLAPFARAQLLKAARAAKAKETA
jgi:hypothetical protein